MKELLISIILVLIIVIVLMKFKDHFHNYTKDTISKDSYMNHVIDAVLFDLNGRYNTNFGFSSILIISNYFSFEKIAIAASLISFMHIRAVGNCTELLTKACI